MFKTEKRGWGIRCLDDIPKGQFICIYAGEVLNEQDTNAFGKKYGDEYLAELDFIEVVEKRKLDYESDVENIEQLSSVSSSSNKGNMLEHVTPRIMKLLITIPQAPDRVMKLWNLKHAHCSVPTKLIPSMRSSSVT